jgi:hypothetical integral membrane protein (TIGR02206 family)
MAVAALAAFTPYGASHLAAIGAGTVLAAVLVVLGRRVRGRPGGARLRRGFAVVLLAILVPFQVYSMGFGNWDLARSLPFELCDLTWMACAYALWTGSRRAAGLVYYWGLTLTSQALITPRLDHDFPHPAFLMFWAMHGLVVIGAVFLVWGLGARPGWRDYRLALAATAGWGLAMLGFNALAGTNYVFVNAKLPSSSILDLLGPWPAYLAVEVALIAAVWAAMTWPWERRGGGGGRGRGP